MVSSPSPSGSGLGCQVRCSGCREILNVPAGINEFSCPRCKLPQMLPPELLSMGGRGSAAAPAAAPQGIDPTKIQLPCAHCKALLNVPHGLARFACPQCGVDLAVDLTKLQHNMSSMASLILPGFGDHPAEEVNEVHQRHKLLRVVRLETTEERQRVVGLLIPNAAVPSVLQGLQWVQDLDP